MLSFSFTNIEEIFSRLATSPQRRRYLLMSNSDIPSFVQKAVSLVDAFNHTNHFLGSILGHYDGNVYPKLYEAAWKDPFNESDVPDGFHEYIRPLLKHQLQTARL